MTEKTRTEHSARNTSIAMFSQIIAIAMGYVTRMVFTHTMSESYVGINGLFTDILNVLALSELGIGTAIAYALYKPVAQGDVERQKSLMKLFRRLYYLVALLIAVAGLLVVPFLGYLVRDAGDVEHILSIYLLYLASSVLSYLLIYKRTLVEAHQQSYIGTLYQIVFLFVQYAVQIVVLLTTRNFILFLLIHLLCTIGHNICIARKADSLYPYLRDKHVEPLPRKERQGIIKNIRGMLMHKCGDVVVNNTDHLLLSAMVGIVSVAKYSNYYLIIGSVRQVLDQAFKGITASVGNLGVAEENRGRVRQIFEVSFFAGQWMYGFASICLFQLLTPFVSISFGENYVFPTTLVFVLCLNLFVTGMRQAVLVFRDSLGLFWYNRYQSLAEAVINLAASIALTLRFGIIGVFLGTFIGIMLTSFWIEPWVLYKKELKSPIAPFFGRYVLYSAVVFGVGALTHAACELVPGEGFGAFLITLLICLILPNLLFLLCYHRTCEFRFLWQKFRRLGRKKRDEASQSEARELEPLDKTLLEMLRRALTGEGPAHWELTAEMWDALLQKAERHAVLPLLYDILMEQPLSERQREFVAQRSRKTVLQSYRLSFRTHQFVTMLEEQGITAVVLKGVAAAGVYPTPELRKSGDIDLLLPYPQQLPLARDVLLKAGATVSDSQHANHHLAMSYADGITLELHTMLAEPFDDAGINSYLDDCLLRIPAHIERQNILGYEFPALSDGYQAYQLLLHMLQHFLHAGFGLKLLCDWVYFWSRSVAEEEIELYWKLAEESGTMGFSKLVTSICVSYLGLDRACGLCRHMDQFMDEAEVSEFLGDIMEAEDFGKSGQERIVALRGTRLWDYIREFHHVMHMNFPRAGKVFLFWPVLWCITLVRFLRNNRRIRGVTAKEVLKKAGERSGRMARLELFKQEKR